MNDQELIQEIKRLDPRPLLYQGFNRIGLEAQRSTEERFDTYGLGKFLHKDSVVLDVGCHTGYMSLLVSEIVKEVHGVDIDKNLIGVANLVKDYLGIKNCTFYHLCITKFDLGIQYDFILFCAVHHWDLDTTKRVIDKIVCMLKVGGRLLFETHELGSYPETLEGILFHFDELGLEPVESGHIKAKVTRGWTILQLKER